MKWSISYIPEAIDDIRKLDGSQRILVRKAIEKVRINPLPKEQGGYGKRWGNKNSISLSGYFKVKIVDAGIRIVYTLEVKENCMIIIIVGARKDNMVYVMAGNRISKYFG